MLRLRAVGERLPRVARILSERVEREVQRVGSAFQGTAGPRVGGDRVGACDEFPDREALPGAKQVRDPPVG
ncbi:MAG: hypothetical protein RL562_14 [Planctomycetota bacterium]